MPHAPLRYQAILLELEGVLADTAPLRRTALARALAAEGVTADDAVLRELSDGRAVADLPPHLRARFPQLDDTTLDLVALRADRAFDGTLAGGLSLVPGGREFVAELSGRLRLGVVTRLSRRRASAILELAELEAAFEIIIAAEDAAPKPAPAPYLHAVERLARRSPVQAARVLALENAADGITAAVHAGLACIAVGALPAHDAMEACGYLESLDGVTLDVLERVAEAGDTGASR